MAIGCVRKILLDELEFKGDIGAKSLPAYLNRDLVEHFLVVKEKRTKIYPYSLRLQRSPNGVHILKDIISSIKKETRGNPRESIRLLIIEKGKLPTNNTEIRLPLQLLRRRLIRNSNASKHILLIIVVSR